MGYFAVIDTETNWENRVMSIGIVIADCDSFCPVDRKYNVLTPEYFIGGMYEAVLFPKEIGAPNLCSRKEALEEIKDWLSRWGVTDIYAYNASFDRNHLPELSHLTWYDIIRLAAYRQYNPAIPAACPCCSTGRMKRSYGVEPMMRLLSGYGGYQETHNAWHDVMDELEIMQLLRHPLSDYIPL